MIMMSLGVWLCKKRHRAAEAEEMNKDINDVFGTYGEYGFDHK